MARNRSNQQPANVAKDNPPPTVWEQPNKAKFINVSLNSVDEKWLADNLKDMYTHIEELLTAAPDHACRVSVVPDIKSGRYNATLTPYLTSSPRFGLILSVRAKTPALALYALAYADGHKVGAWDIAADNDTSLFG